MQKYSFRYFKEKIAESILLLSSLFTSIAVIFIIIFLFKEGYGLFNEKPIEKGYNLSIHPSNKLNNLTAKQIKLIFDRNVTNWKDLGGDDRKINLLTIEKMTDIYTKKELGEGFEYLSLKINEYVIKDSGVVAFFAEQFLDANFKGKKVLIDDNKIKDFITDKEWYPTASPAAQFGTLSLIMGTLWVSLGAILFALPFGLSAAIFLAEVSNPKLRNILKPLIELLAGIPSVVYGFFGLVVIVPFIQQLFNLPVGETALAGSLVLGIMALPTIITISEDALRTTPQSLKEASLALGATRWQTILKVTIPYSISGITAAVMLGMGRAIGETMAVLMVTGNAAVIPTSFLQPIRTIPATIAAELGEAPAGGIHFKALFALGIILFLITLIINLTVEFIKISKKSPRL
ncbi:MAG: phosphate ABC transporter permease subunit PstC [Bacteroidetes bacterium GWE2_29_8]|nr:MAG: phosphate ABC transporter permease subunit PstC [Bacteroidetes bacterium GWE2_29_8]OFY23195.1 MAG: phosphate ABC transporter permease subunit PstC [Bacteroidetes bacterium GWF2_29_10]